MMNVGIRPAAIWHMPLVFLLMRGGAFEGQFSEEFIGRNGRVNLLIYLVRLLLRQTFPYFLTNNVLVVMTYDQTDIGMLHVERVLHKVGAQVYCINMLAMLRDPIHRNISKTVIASMKDMLCSGAMLTASCNKYSKELQHTLKTLQFFRYSDRSRGNSLYIYEKVTP